MSSPVEHLTFALAVAGYAGLTITAVRAVAARPYLLLWRLAAAAIVAHVVLVWSVRFEWRIALATRNGFAGLIVFHAALLLILTSLAAPAALARRAIVLAFLVVSGGALGAVFREPAVFAYRVPVIVLAVSGTVGMAVAIGNRRQERWPDEARANELDSRGGPPDSRRDAR